MHFKLTSKLLTTFTLLYQTVRVAADFHVGWALADNNVVNSYTTACPSNYYNCNCFFDDDRAALGPTYDVIADGGNFSIEGGLCGLSQLDFYNVGGGHYQFYVHNGDGTLQGDCYTNVGSVGCGGAIYEDRLVCYSYICGS